MRVSPNRPKAIILRRQLALETIHGKARPKTGEKLNRFGFRKESREDYYYFFVARNAFSFFVCFIIHFFINETNSAIPASDILSFYFYLWIPIQKLWNNHLFSSDSGYRYRLISLHSAWEYNTKLPKKKSYFVERKKMTRCFD